MKQNFYTRLLEWVKKNVQPPLHVQIVPTNLCNIACIFCWRVWEQEESKKIHLKDRISDKRYLEIVKEICSSPALKPKSITITGGGEPMVKKSLVLKMVKEIKERGIHCEIVTNGTLLDERTVKKLVAYKLDNLCISINAANEKLADFLYGKKGSYKKTIKGMKLLLKWKEKLNSSHPIVANTIVVTKYNYNEICNMVEQAAEFGVNTLNVRWVTEPYCEGKPGPLTMPAEKYGEFTKEFKNAKKLAKRRKINLVSDFTLEDLKRYLRLDVKDDSKTLFKKEKSRKKKSISLLSFLKRKDAYKKLNELGICTFPFYELFIDASGYASGCGTLAASKGGYKEGVAEDITKKSIKECWYGDRLNNLRVLMFLRKFPNTCKACNVINIVKMSREFPLNF